MNKTNTQTFSPNILKIIKLLESLAPVEKDIVKNIIREEDKDWGKRFDKILKRIRSKTKNYSAQEIQSIVDETVTEVRKINFAKSGY